MKIIDGNITSPKGFKATGNSIGLKEGKRDLALIYSDKPAVTAAVFTKNIVQAAPVQWDKKLMQEEKLIQGVIANSGNANACTGEKGYQDTIKTAEIFARLAKIDKESVFIASTGVIGVPLKMDLITKGIENTFNKLGYSKEDGDLAANAIMTTDTVPKTIAVEYIDKSGVKITIGGMIKGSGMICPNMGTMLGFITTDVSIKRDLLDKILKESIENSYNMISVDGDTSTNDTIVVLANGMAGNTEITSENEDYTLFKEALHSVNVSLSQKVVKDGEGAKKVITINIKGAASIEDAKLMCRSVINSSLVKTAFFGEDANWGRILCAMGYSGGNFNPNKVNIAFSDGKDTIDLMKNGTPIIFDEEYALKILKKDAIQVLVVLGDGEFEATAWGCDLSFDYVKINANYRT